MGLESVIVENYSCGDLCMILPCISKELNMWYSCTSKHTYCVTLTSFRLNRCSSC